MKNLLLVSSIYAAATPAFWATFFYYRRRKVKNIAIDYAFWFFLFILIIFVGVIADYNQFKEFSLIMLFFYPFCMIGSPILFIFFLYSLCLHQQKVSTLFYLFFLVPLFQFLISAYAFYIYSPIDTLKLYLYEVIFGKKEAIPLELFFPFLVNWITSLLFIVGLISAIIISFYLIPRITRYSIQDKSYIGKKRISGFLAVLSVLAFLSICAIIQQTMLSKYILINWQISTEIFWGTGWLAIGYVMLRIINIERLPINRQDQKQEISLQQLIYEHFENDKPYLNSRLTLDQLAKDMNSNRTYISKTLKEEMGTNFNDFVNGFRISFAKKMLAEQNDSKLNEVALQAGFNSYSTFFRVFKDHTGISPSEFTKYNLLKISI